MTIMLWIYDAFHTQLWASTCQTFCNPRALGSLQCGDGSSSLVLIFNHVQYSGRIAAFSTQVFTTKFSNQDCSVLKSFNTASTPPLMCCLILPWPWFAMAWMHVFRSGIYLEWWRRWRSSIGFGPRPIEEKETVETETERGSDNNCRQVQERPFAETTIKSMSLCSEDLPPAILGEGEVCWVLSVYSRLVRVSQSRPRPNCNLKPYDLFTSLVVARLTVPQLLYSHFSDVNQAFDRIRVLLTKAGDEFQTSWELLSLPTCRRAWQSLHAMGYLLGIQNSYIMWHYIVEKSSWCINVLFSNCWCLSSTSAEPLHL